MDKKCYIQSYYSPLKNSWQLANEAQLLLWFFHIYIYVTVSVFPLFIT